ncbi:tRNA 2-methylthio-N6-isopentenyl adenosine(37) hydroxylase MiaE [bacterium]|nr:tRNA 2-methylthio-N6-isopentenyl adenosine(37) hydroxylase MiaE [bacterium]
MLGLKLPTDPRWVDLASQKMEDILSDHAWCEQKAASTAISLLVTYPEYPDLVEEMAALAREEMSHFEMVHRVLQERQLSLGRERKDDYVNRLNGFFPKTSDRLLRLVHRLLVAALIEARSCERFKLLSEQLSDEELRHFYRRLMASEAGHYRLFLDFARRFGGREQTDALWQQLLDFEADIMKEYGTKESIHG